MIEREIPLHSKWWLIWSWYVKRSLDFFFRRMEASGIENIPKDKPIIFASNHTDALIDPLVITYFSGKQHYFMTRGDVFKQKLIGALFRSWRMLPIFRLKDGMASLQQNNPIMDFVIERLKEGHSIIIFPEGSHFWENKIQPLKKGLARMAHEVMHQNPDSDLVIIPVGLHYSDMIALNKDVLVRFGQPIAMKDLKKFDNEAQSINNLNKILRAEMQKLIVNISLNDHDEFLNNMRLDLEKISSHLSITENVKRQEWLISELESWLKSNPEIKPSFESLVQLLQSKVLPESVQQQLQNWMVGQAKELSILKWIKFPLYALATTQFLIPFIIGKSLLKNIKDRTFHHSFKFGIGLILAPIILMIQGLVISFILGHIGWFFVYLLMIPLWAYFFIEYRGSAINEAYRNFLTLTNHSDGLKHL